MTPTVRTAGTAEASGPASQLVAARAVALTGTALGVLLLALLLGRGHAWGARAGEIATFAFPLLASIGAWRARRSSTGRTRVAWTLMALSGLTYAAGGAVWTYGGFAHTLTFPSTADALFLAYGPLAIAGLLLFPSPRRDGHSLLRTLADGCVIGLSLATLGCVLVLDSVFDSHLHGMARVVALSYPAVDLFNVTFVLTLALRAAPSGRRMWMTVAGGFACLALFDALVVRGSRGGAFQPGGLATVLVAVGFCAFAAAPRLVQAPEQRLDRLSGWQEILPFLPFTGCLAVVVTSHDARDLPVVRWLLLTLLLALAVRQILSIREKIRLSDGLEDRVALRTSELHGEREFLQAVVGNLHDGVIACDAHGTMDFFNPTALVMLGRRPRDVTRDQVVQSFGLRHPDTLQPMAVEDLPLSRALRGQVVDGAEIVVQGAAAGEDRYLSCSARALHDVAGTITGAVCALHDITDQRRSRQALERRALRDELTGLGNRAQLNDDLHAAQLRTPAPGRQLAVLLLDLDNFKKVNDSLGHATGDALLTHVAQRIRRVLRTEDSAARLGGDEFVLLLPDTTELDARHVADRLLDVLDEPVRLEGTELSISASIGVALTDAHDRPRNLLAAADLAMYLAKSRGKGGVAVFEPHMQLAALDRLSLESDLRHALRSNELHLHYQPIIELATGRLRGVEALARWTHPGRGDVTPDEFIPVAEDSGLIVPLGDWALRQAAAQLAEWDRQFPSVVLTMSVNVSLKQLERPPLLATLTELIVTGLPPDRLVLEITETALTRDDVTARETLNAIRRLGVQLAVDDFGTGYSSLGRLRAAPVSRLKIDRSFVEEITDSTPVPLVDAAIALAHGLGLLVVAEGVETLAQLHYLRARDCERGQGYLFARPMTPDAIDTILAGDLPWQDAFAQRPTTSTPRRLRVISHSYD